MKGSPKLVSGRKADVSANQSPGNFVKRRTFGRVGSAAGRVRQKYGVMASKKEIGKLLRSRRKLRNRSSTVDAEPPRTSSRVSQEFKTARSSQNNQNDEEGKATLEVEPPQSEGTGKRRGSVEIREDRNKPQSFILSRRLTRAMHRDRGRNLRRITKLQPEDSDSGIEYRSRALWKNGKRRDMKWESSIRSMSGLQKRVTRFKVAKKTPHNAFTRRTWTENSVENLEDATNMSVYKALDKIAVKGRKLRPAGVVRSDSQPVHGADSLRSSSPGPVTRAKGSGMLPMLNDHKEASLRLITRNGIKREVFDCSRESTIMSGDENGEGLASPHEKAALLKRKRGNEQAQRLQHVNHAIVPEISNKELTKPTIDLSAVPANYLGMEIRKRKLVAEASPVDIIQEQVKAPVRRGGLFRNSTVSPAGGQSRLRDGVDMAITCGTGAAHLGDSTAPSGDIPHTVPMCRNGKEEKAELKLEQGARMLRRSKRKRIMDDSSDAEFPLHRETSLPNTLSKGAEVGRGACISDHLEDNRAPCLGNRNKVLQQRNAPLQELAREQESQVLKSEADDSAGEHLLDPMGNSTGSKDVGLPQELSQDGVGPNDAACKVDSRRKCFLVATNPTETGGRQMRPRPLDLDQPLLVLVEGRDQDYYDFDGGSFYRMLQQQGDLKKISCDQMVSTSSSKRSSDALEREEGKRNPIKTPSFRIVPDFEEQEQRSRLTYTVPQGYIRGVNETAIDDNSQAEYDVDEEDEDWLKNFNQTMSDSAVSSVLSKDQFEKIIDILENRAAELEDSKSLPAAYDHDWSYQDRVLQTDDCCICNGGENSASNLVLQCASCHIHVHQSCYGVQELGMYTKDKKWYCRKCEAVLAGNVNFEVSCALCCKQGGALKPATEPLKWVHVVCALYTNETFFVNPDAMEPIDGVMAAVVRARKQRRRCWLCGLREGSIERCSVKVCKAGFHVSCGVTQGASFELQHFNQQVVYVRCFCPEHANVAPVSSAVKQMDFASTNEGDKERNLQKASCQSSGFEEKPFPMAEENKKNNSIMKRRDQKKLARSTYPRKDGSVLERYKNGGYRTGLRSADCECIALRHRMVARDCAKQRYSEESPIFSDVCLEQGFQEEKGFAEKVSSTGTKVPGSMLNLEAAMEMNIASPQIMEGIYSYWLSKRAKIGGALLHSIQQEQAAKEFDIFNLNAANDHALSLLPQGTAIRHGGMYFEMKQKMMTIWQQLRKLQKLSSLVVQRERIKGDIVSIDRDIIRLLFERCRARITDQSCFWCKANSLLLHCTFCNKDVCFQCFNSKAGYGFRSWLAALKLEKFVCNDCQTDCDKEDRTLACKPSSIGSGDGRDGQMYQIIQQQDTDKAHPSLVNLMSEQNGSPLLNDCGVGCLTDCDVNHRVRKEDPFYGDREKGVDVAICSGNGSTKKPKILFPPSKSNNRDKYAIEAFWESVEQNSHSRTVLISELLKKSLCKSDEDIADAPKKHSLKSSSRKKR